MSVSPASSTAHLAQHLADDDLDVLIVDLNALAAVGVLHFLEQIFLNALHAHESRRISCGLMEPSGQLRARLRPASPSFTRSMDTVMDRDRPSFRWAPPRVRDGDLALFLVFAAWTHVPLISARIVEPLGLAGLEQLLNAGKTLRDIGGRWRRRPYGRYAWSAAYPARRWPARQ